MKKLQSKAIFWLIVYFSIFQSLNSTWMVRALHISQSVSRVITLLVYLPFVLAAGWKLIADAKQLKTAASKASNWIFYGFGLYYLALCAYRLANGLEVKENLYFSLIFFGAVAIYMLLRDGKVQMSQQELKKNLLWIVAFFVLYRLVYILVGRHFLEKSPINVNLTSGVVAFLLPFVGNLLTDPALDKKKSLFPWAVLCAGVIVVATTGSRALFLLTSVNLAVMLVVTLIRRKGVLRFVTATAVGLAIVIAMILGNVGPVRYYAYRQTGIDFETIWKSYEQKHPNAEQWATGSSQQPTEAPTQETPVIGDSAQVDKDAAQAQIAASNWMRKLLVQRGVAEIEKNPWFGTGDVLYNYRLGENYIAVQSSHNFVIEAVVCYGLLGFGMIAALFVSLLIEAKIFAKQTLRRWNDAVTLLLTMVFFFAFGMVQPTVFDVLMCPLFLAIVMACCNALTQPQ